MSHRHPATGVTTVTLQAGSYNAPASEAGRGIDCIRERLSGSVTAEPQYLRFDSRPTETDLCTFGCKRNLAETQISVTAVTITRPKLRFRLRHNHNQTETKECGSFGAVTETDIQSAST